MSLNGLDDVKIREAYDTVITKANGWFLLKYASRDEIELLECGGGGIIDMRNTLTSYEEPLFGFLRYRDKNVLIKYVPCECSRLVQARVTVHLGAVTDQFSPNDAVISIGSPRELRDKTLSAACSLHAMPGSRSSSISSLNRKPLLEIAEEESDEEDLEAERSLSILNPPISESSASQSGSSHGLSPSRKNSDPNASSSVHRRNTKSSQNENFVHSPYYSYGRQKVKLCPRPSVDIVGRYSPQTTSAYRPVSTLPAGLKPFAKACRLEKEHPRIRYTSESPIRAATPNLSSAPQDHLTSLCHSVDRPSTSSGFSIRSLPSPALSANSKLQAKESAKARLLRAQEMRKKKIEAIEPSKLENTSVKPIPPEMTPPMSPNSFADIQPALSMIHDETSFDGSLFLSGPNSALKTDDSDGTRSESCSMFAVATSEGAESTKASSISESMEELFQEFSTVAPAITDNSMMSPALTDLGAYEDVNVKSDVPSSRNDLSEAETELPVLSPTVYHPAKKSSAKLTFPNKTHNSIESVNEIVHNPEEVRPSLVKYSSNENDNLPQTATPSNCSISVSQQEIVKSEDVEFGLRSEQQTAHSPGSNETTGWDVPRSKFSLPRSKFSVPYVLENCRQNDAIPRSKDNDLPPQSRRPSRLEINSCESQNENSSQSEASRRGVRTDLETTPRSIAESDVNFSSDDEFMEELQSAVFQDARPISVAKTPSSLSPIARNFSESNLIKRSSLAPSSKEELSNSRSLTHSRFENSRSTDLTRTTSQCTTLMARKTNLGSSISQRIKALEKLSVQESEINSTPSTITIVPTFFPVRKITCVTTLNGNLSSQPYPQQSPQSRTSPKNLNEKSTPQSQVSLESIPKLPNSTQDMSHQNQSKFSTHTDHEDPSSCGDLRLVPEDDLSRKSIAEIRSNSSFSTPVEQLTTSTESTLKERRSSFAVIVDLFTDRQRSSAMENRRSVSLENPSLSSPKSSPSLTTTPYLIKGLKRDSAYSNRFSLGRDTEQNLSLPQSSSPILSNFDEKSEAKSNRTSWILSSRVSPSLSTRRRSVSQEISNTARQVELQNSADPPTIIGDVNVQFPDTLFWKRKTLLLDSEGNLIMAPFMSTHNGSTSSLQNTGVSRKFSIREFKMPHVPHVEVEELPNSVVLDFIGSGSLQIACEHRIGQERLLNTLQDAYRRWTIDT